MNASEQHIIDVLETRLRPLLVEAAELIEALKPNEKIPATKLAAIVAEKHGMTGPQLYPTLLFLIKDYPGVKVLRGAKGGIVKLDTSKVDVTQQGE